MKKLLVYTYFSENCYNAVKYAIDLSLDTEIPLKIIHFYRSPKAAGMLLSIDKRLHDDAVSEMDMMKKRLIKEYGEKDLRHVEAMIGFGETTKSLTKSLKRNKADLLIVSAKDEYDSSDIFLGSSTGALLRRTNIPLLVVPEKCKYDPLSRVLFAIHKPRLANKAMIKPLKELLKYSEADLSILTFSGKKKDSKFSGIGEHLSKLKPISIAPFEGEDIYTSTSKYLKKNKFDMLCVIRKKNGFLNNFLLSTSLSKKKFSISFPFLVLRGN